MENASKALTETEEQRKLAGTHASQMSQTDYDARKRELTRERPPNSPRPGSWEGKLYVFVDANAPPHVRDMSDEEYAAALRGLGYRR